MAEEGTPPALVVATRAAERACSPGSGPACGARATVEPDLFQLCEEEPGGSRPDRLAGVRPQERVQRHTVEQIVDAAPGLPVLDALVPLVVEQLVDVLAFVEEEEKQEEGMMDWLEDMILKGAPVSAADVAAWRRWGSGTKRKRKKQRKKKLPKASSS